jgi:hypothetical protein
VRAWLAAGCGAIVVLVAVAGLALGWWGASGTTAAASGTPLAVRTSLTPPASLFADPLTAEIDVQYDPGKIDASSIKVTPTFVPYSAVGAPAVSHSAAGGQSVLRIAYTIECDSDGCLPTAKQKVIALPPVTVTATAAGKPVTASAKWEPEAVSSRLTPADLKGAPSFAEQTVPAAPSYRVDPGWAAGILTVGAIVLLVGAGALVAFELLRRQRRERARKQLEGLELALAYARDAAGRDDPADRRRALELLAEQLDEHGEQQLARSSGEAAWTEDAPSPATTIALADEAEGAIDPGEAS